MGEDKDQNSGFAGTGDVNERSNRIDRPPPVVEVPVSSPRWAWFFTVAALAGIALGLWTSFVGPHLLLKRAEEACRYEQEWRREHPLALEGASPGCQVAREFESRNKLSDRVRAFFYFLPLPLAGFYLARRLRARSALAALQADPRTPVLYLRSFQADQLDEALRSSERPWTEETEMVANLEVIGPVLAIGKPGEKLSHLGAARLYVSDLEWQNVVRQLMEGVRLVVIRVGNTPGIQWELSCARELPGEKIVLWFPQKLKGVGYSTFRENVRERLKVELPESCPKGFVTFNANWEPKLLGLEMATREPAPALPVGEVQEFVSSAAYRQRKPSGAEVASPQTSPPESLAGEPREQVEHSSSMESIPPAVPPRLFELLERLQVNMKAPPPFRLHPVGWVAVALWLLLLCGIPGERWSFALDRLFENYRHLVGIVIEGATVMVVALGVAFFSYIRNPSRYLRSSLLLCAILAADATWILARRGPDNARTQFPTASREAFLEASREVCRKLTACVPPAEIETRLAECIEMQMLPLSFTDNDKERAAMLALTSAGLAKCRSLACDDFEACYKRELGFSSLTAKQKQEFSREALLAASREVCRKLTACVPPAEIETRLDECIEMQMRPLSFTDNDEALAVMLALTSAGLAKCRSLACDDFEACYKRELGFSSLTAKQKRELLQLVCEAVREQRDPAGPKMEEAVRALNELRAPNGLQSLPLGDEILHEALSKCATDDGAKPGTAGRVQ